MNQKCDKSKFMKCYLYVKISNLLLKAVNQCVNDTFNDLQNSEVCLCQLAQQYIMNVVVYFPIVNIRVTFNLLNQ